MKINFTFSPPFERAIFNDSLDLDSTLTAEEADSKAKTLDIFWKSHGEMVEKVLEKITGFSFKMNEVDCYLNSKITVSHPFCLRVTGDERMKSAVVHEIIHQLFKQNGFSSTVKGRQYQEDFKDEHVLTLNHILLHAIHLLLVRELFPETIESIQRSKNPHYARSWEIVSKMGAQNTVDKYLLGK